MKLIVVNIYDNDTMFNVIIKYINNKDKRFLIDNEVTKSFNSFVDMVTYLNNYTIFSEYNKAKIYVDYISNKCFIESVPSLDYQNRIDLKNRLDELYPSFNQSYNVELDTIVLKNKQKNLILRIIPFINKLRLNEINISNKKIVVDHDMQYSQRFIQKNMNYFSNKYMLLCQLESSNHRYIEIINGYIINYLYLYINNDLVKDINSQYNDYQVKEVTNERNTVNKLIYSLIDKKYDEIVIDGSYHDYLEIVECYPNINIVYLSEIDKLKYFNVRKLCDS